MGARKEGPKQVEKKRREGETKEGRGREEGRRRGRKEGRKEGEKTD